LRRSAVAASQLKPILPGLFPSKRIKNANATTPF
jgi:hypothetical protein